MPHSPRLILGDPEFNGLIIRKHVLLSATASILIILACNLSGLPATRISKTATSEPTQIHLPILVQTLTPFPTGTSTLSPTSTQESTPFINLNQQPHYWFAPLPPMPTSEGRQFIGSEDFMRLFEPDAAWQVTASKIQVFKLYGEWIAYHATDAELRQAVEGIRHRRLALAVETGPNPASGDCGQNVESFAGISEGLQIAQRIQQAGGKIDFIAMDEPYYFGHFYDGPNACKWTDQQIAQNIAEYIQAMREIFPNLIVGDTEPLAGPAGAEEYQAWLVAFKAVTGFDLAFIHMDIDWSRPDWPAEILSIEEFGRDRGIPVGIIYTGNFLDDTDQSWISIAGERIKRYELENGGRPDQVLFQSWQDKPDHTLPETDPFTFTGLVRVYFENKYELGFQSSGRGANLAFHKPIRFSKALPGYSGELAVDGDPGTWWSAGEGPPQWIEIDLRAAYDIQSIRLIISQYPAGMTVHKIRGRGPELEANYILLHSFQGITDETSTLSFTPDTPWQDIRFIRVETLESPSWVAWREIEAIDAGAE